MSDRLALTRLLDDVPVEIYERTAMIPSLTTASTQARPRWRGEYQGGDPAVHIVDISDPTNPVAVELSYYTLGAPSDSATVSASTSKGLTQGLEIGVEPFSVDPPYDQDRLP